MRQGEEGMRKEKGDGIGKEEELDRKRREYEIQKRGCRTRGSDKYFKPQLVSVSVSVHLSVFPSRAIPLSDI